MAEALRLPLVAPLSWQPAIVGVLLDELFALASTKALNIIELLQFGRPAALGSVERLPLIFL